MPALVYTMTMPDPSELSFLDLLTDDKRLRFYESHRSVAAIMIVIVFIAPFVGLYAGELWGVAIGVLLSVVVYYLTPYFWLKLVE
ncbi:hypothetical protein [Petrachloros mirabilis]